MGWCGVGCYGMGWCGGSEIVWCGMEWGGVVAVVVWGGVGWGGSSDSVVWVYGVEWSGMVQRDVGEVGWVGWGGGSER